MGTRTVRQGRDWMAANMGGTEVARIALATLDGLEARAADDPSDPAPVEFRYEDVAAWSGLDVRSDGLVAAVAHLVNGGVGVADLEYEVETSQGTRIRYDGRAYKAAKDRGEAPEDRTFLVFAVPRGAFALPTDGTGARP